MAASPTPRRANKRCASPEQALSFAPSTPALPLAVALSGGADSTALLLACVRRWPGQVRAVHVHHGLQSAADGFEQFCRDLCQRLQVPLLVQHVNAHPRAGQSPEDAARQARYQAIAQALQHHWPEVRDVAVAQHADDQIETLLIALARGSGLPGLAGMPAQWQRFGLRWHRPWLALSATELRQWLQQQGQAWVEDPSNQNPQFTRNRIRAQVLPALEAALPGFRSTFARSMGHIAQAQHLLDEQAEQDLQRVGVPPALVALQALPSARQAQVLRLWLRSEHGCIPSTAQLHELQAQIAHCTSRAQQLHIKVGQGHALRQGQHLHWQATPPPG